MNQCVPSWDLDENPTPPRLNLRPQSNSNTALTDVPSLDYEVTELTWENGQLAMHGLGPARIPTKSMSTWDKPPSGGTLESIVNQATRLPDLKSATIPGGDEGGNLVPWFSHHRATANTTASASVTMTMDALVPCRNDVQEPSSHVLRGMGGSARVGSCSAGGAAKLARVGMESSYRGEQSVSGSATCGRDSLQMTFDTCDRDLGNSLVSPENTSSGKECTKTLEENDSVCHSHSRSHREVGDDESKRRNGKSSVSTKRSRAAAIHNQSERKRRDKINQRMKTLQKLVPNSSKTDKASMLDEVIEYLKQLQAQVNMMSRMNMPSLMMPLAMQPQLQLSMMAQMGMGMAGMGMGLMDMNTINRANVPGIPPILPNGTPFMPIPMWENHGERLPPSTSMMPDPLSTFLACQSQPMTMDAYTRMATLYQQFQQPPGGSGLKN